MERSTAFDLRCPTCAAHVPAGASWCTLCYADLRPAPAAAPAPCPEPAAPVPAPVGTPAEGPSGRRGKHARRDPDVAGNQPEADVEAVAARLLAELAASESGPALGRYSDLVDSTGKKVAVMAGGTAAAMAVLFLLMVALGSLL